MFLCASHFPVRTLYIFYLFGCVLQERDAVARGESQVRLIFSAEASLAELFAGLGGTLAVRPPRPATFTGKIRVSAVPDCQEERPQPNLFC